MKIELDHVSVRAGDVTLLKPVSLAVAAGEALIVRGHNGTGKSTLLRVLAGVLPPTQGKALIDGRQPDTRSREFRRTVAAMIGLPPMAQDLTVRDHIALVVSTWYSTTYDTEEITESVLSRMSLSSLASRFPHELSSGQVQLFGLALVLARPFDLIIVDEPEQRLDDDRLTMVSDELRSLMREGVTVVSATHSSRLAEELGGRLIDLDVPG